MLLVSVLIMNKSIFFVARWVVGGGGGGGGEKGGLTFLTGKILV